MPAPLSRSLIRHLDLFKSLSEEGLDAVLAQAQSSRLQEGEFAFRQGDIAERFFLLLHGQLKVMQTTPDGEQIVVRYVSPGEIFGIAHAMGRPDYPATAIAVKESLLLAWPSAVWGPLMQGNANLAANALQTVGRRLQDAHSRIKELSTEEVEQRVARALLRLVDQSGRATDGGILIDFPITRQDIAEMTGTTLHTVSRLMSAWKERGLVDSGRRRITVCDMNELVRLAEGGTQASTSPSHPGA